MQTKPEPTTSGYIPSVYVPYDDVEDFAVDCRVRFGVVLLRWLGAVLLITHDNRL